MIRISVLVCLLAVAGCADQSKGSALNECRMKHYLDAADTQRQAIPDCMQAKSFQMTSGCNAQPDEEEWDWQVQAFPYDNARCYRSIGAAAWTATLLSPM
ncbi:MAG TPA: hypothetical protein VL614_27515 [Acetobacteraceae bacterium]|jgi:hypothetical protein|nr:hypothetical protein [Acetobacteraceae bacterium]